MSACWRLGFGKERPIALVLPATLVCKDLTLGVLGASVQGDGLYVGFGHSVHPSVVPRSSTRAGEGPGACWARVRARGHVCTHVAAQPRSRAEARSALLAHKRNVLRFRSFRAAAFLRGFLFGPPTLLAANILGVDVEEMPLGCGGSAERLGARLGWAAERPLPCVCALVRQQVGPNGEAEAAGEAAEGPLARVHPVVALEGQGGEEALVAQAALEAAFLLVAEAVLCQGGQLQVAPAAHLAHVRGLAPVTRLVGLHLLVREEGLSA